jgi:hypothetical protein
MLLVYLYCLGARRQLWMPFRQPFLAAGEQFVENKMSCRIKLISLLFYRFIKKRLRALGQPLWMAAHVSDWGNLLNRRRREGKRNTMVMMFVGGVVLLFD